MAAIVYPERDNDLLAYEHRVALERLHAEIERLQAALREIADLRYDNTSAATLAQKALEPKP